MKSMPNSFPVAFNPHPRFSFCCLVSLAEWHHIWCAILLNVIIDLHMSILGTLAPQGKGLDMCFMQPGVKFTEV